jgi:hypothetical protein
MIIVENEDKLRIVKDFEIPVAKRFDILLVLRGEKWQYSANTVRCLSHMTAFSTPCQGEDTASHDAR